MKTHTTITILAYKALNRDVDQAWVDWVVEMLLEGHDQTNLAILAGESEPFNQFQMQELATKVLDEMGLDYSDPKRLINNYVSMLIDQIRIKEINTIEGLRTLKNLYEECNYRDDLFYFMQLFHALDDLNDFPEQFYYTGATRENIGQLIEDHFREWKALHGPGNRKDSGSQPL